MDLFLEDLIQTERRYEFRAKTIEERLAYSSLPNKHTGWIFDKK